LAVLSLESGPSGRPRFSARVPEGGGNNTPLYADVTAGKPVEFEIGASTASGRISLRLTPLGPAAGTGQPKGF
jgi:hypothetical protein